MAMLIQTLSAKVGIATGKNLPELCRERFPKPVSWGLWVQAELIAMATDLAEFIGAAIALNLLFGVPLFVAGLMTGVVAFGILALQQRGYRKFELAIGALLALILLGFLYDTLSVAHDVSGIARGFIPSFAGTDSVLLATGILGATVMPHVIYLHSALTQDRIAARDDRERRSLMRFGKVDVLIAMGVAGLINMSMLIVAGSLFHGQARASTASRAPTRASRSTPALGRRWPSRSRCWPRASRPRAWGRTRARWSCRASSPAPSRWRCGGW